MENVNIDEENATPKKKRRSGFVLGYIAPKVTLFGKDIATIPCFRNSFICGICTGVAGGLIAFMMTSKAMFSSHTAFASLWVGVFAYWIPCRYKHESTILMHESWKEAHRQMIQRKRELDSEKSSATASPAQEK